MQDLFSVDFCCLTYEDAQNGATSGPSVFVIGQERVKIKWRDLLRIGGGIVDPTRIQRFSIPRETGLMHRGTKGIGLRQDALVAHTRPRAVKF